MQERRGQVGAHPLPEAELAHRRVEQRLQLQQGDQLVARPRETSFCSRVREERQTQVPQLQIERNHPLVRGVNVLDRRQPLDQDCSVPRGLLQPFDRIPTMGIYAGPV